MSLRHVPIALWLALGLALLLAVTVPRFATAGNAENLLRVAAILGIAACGQAIVLVLGGIDFSTGASVALVSVVTVLLLQHQGPAIAISGGFAIAILVGWMNGLLVATAKLSPVVATLGTSLVISGLASHAVGGMPLDPIPTESFGWLGRGTVAGIPVPILVAGVAFAFLHLMLRSVTGRHWFMIGTNPNAARLAGLPVRRAVQMAYLSCGAFTALAGAILTSRVASAQPQLFPTLPFEAVAACAVGGVSLLGGRGSAAQVLAGVLIVAMMNNAVVLLNMASAYQQLLMAGVIIAAVALQGETRLALVWQRLRAGAPYLADRADS